MTEVAQAKSEPILEVRELKTYFFLEGGGAVRAVDGVSYAIGRNETLGVVGESGCGKSVTALSIMRLIKSPPGRIVDGEILFRANGSEPVDLAKLDARGPEIRRIRGAKIAMIFQEPMTSLNPLYTVGKQISESVSLHQGVGKQEAEARALEMLRRVRIADPEQRIDEYPHQMSGGMRQRVMIAMALSCNPAVLIADEPTTALDVTVQAQILDLMRELQNDFGSSIILITHNLGVVSQTVDHVAVMYLGKIVEIGPTKTVLSDPGHPYTQALLSVIPIPNPRRRRKRMILVGETPNPIDLPSGCRFHPRCPVASDRCSQSEPQLRSVGRDHQVACL